MDCLAKTLNASAQERKKRRQEVVDRAGLLLKLAKNSDTMNMQDAMRHTGFTEEEVRDPAYQRRVYRRRDELATPMPKKKQENPPHQP
jgi:hypothetical protein